MPPVPSSDFLLPHSSLTTSVGSSTGSSPSRSGLGPALSSDLDAVDSRAPRSALLADRDRQSAVGPLQPRGARRPAACLEDSASSDDYATASPRAAVTVLAAALGSLTVGHLANTLGPGHPATVGVALGLGVAAAVGVAVSHREGAGR